MSEPVKPPDSTPAPPTTQVASANHDPVAAAEAHLAGLDMAKQRAIVKGLTK
jgi:hypothetical protein